eukprot:643877-Prorocentrum_minimum.AAC.1
MRAPFVAACIPRQYHKYDNSPRYCPSRHLYRDYHVNCPGAADVVQGHYTAINPQLGEYTVVQPDIVVLEGWPETVDPPKCPVTHWTSPTRGTRRAVRVRIGELACTSSDLQSDSRAVSRKRAKYEPL